MERIPEPELMLDPLQARAYAEADFEEAHTRVIRLFQKSFPSWVGGGAVLDLGCGPGDVSLRFAQAYPECQVDGIDGSEPMLDAGRARLEAADLGGRVKLYKALLPTDPAPRPRYDGIISNSLLHHLHEPQVLWEAIKRYAKPQAPVFIVDLLRPANFAAALYLLDQYTQDEPELLRKDFLNSLCAAFNLEEIKAQLCLAGLSYFDVRAISDRHVMIRGRFHDTKM